MKKADFLPTIDVNAFRLLVETHQDRVYNTCYGFFRNREDTEDAAQEVFLEVYQSYAKFRNEAQPATWIYRIAVTKCIDILRKRNRKKRFGGLQYLFGIDNDTEQYGDPKGLDPEQTAEAAERIQILQQALNMLADSQRVAITLSKMEGFSNKEIADIMETSVSSVEALIHRAKKNLYKTLYHYYRKHQPQTKGSAANSVYPDRTVNSFP